MDNEFLKPFQDWFNLPKGESTWTTSSNAA